MQSLDAKELSKAAPFLGSLSLRCSEQQMEALAARLTSSAAFGPASAWGPEIFTEIGTLAGEGQRQAGWDVSGVLWSLQSAPARPHDCCPPRPQPGSPTSSSRH
nr:PREDICTED: stereocilin-like [Apteryx mantelli mantelli]